MKHITALSIVLLLSVASTQAATRSVSRMGAGARYHKAQDTVVAAPFDNDVSYGVFYEYHEGETFWQLGVNYASSMGSNDVDYVLTPEINLIFADDFWLGGTGILSSYVSDETTSDWSDIYFQLILGFQIPVGNMSLEVLGYYVFDDFDALGEFDFDEIDIGVWLMYKF